MASKRNREDLKDLKELQKEELNRRETELKTRTSLRSVAKTNPKMIVLYAEKGGVGKTTLCHTLAHMFSQTHRVLLYDVDSQRSATTWAFANELNSQPDIDGDLNRLIDRNFENFFNNSPERNPGDFHKTLYDQVADTDAENVKPAYAHQIRRNLFIVPGHRHTNLLDTEITTIEVLSAFNPNVTNVKTGKPFRSIMKTAEEFKIDYVFVDLNPNTGTLNQRLIMTSHFLIIPTIPDFFSYEMMKSMNDNLDEWQSSLDMYRIGANASNYKLPDHTVKFLGFILNRYVPILAYHSIELSQGIAQDRLRQTQQFWFEKTQEAANEITAGLSIRNPRLAVRPNTYQRLDRLNLIGKVREYWSLNEFSSLFCVPVPFLQDHHLYRMVREEDEEQYLRLQPKEREKPLSSINEYNIIFRAIKENISRIIDAENQERN